MPWPFYLCLFVAAWITSVNIMRAFYKLDIPVMNILIMSASIVGCVFFALER